MNMKNNDLKTESQKFVCVVAVWGEEYTRLLLEIALPSQLAPNNLPALTWPCIYQIYTTSKDALYIRNSTVFSELERIVPVEIHLIEDLNKNPYQLMSACHKRAICYANSIDAAIIFLTPDCIISDGSLANLQRLANQHIRVVSTVGLRIKKEAVVSLVETRYKSIDQQFIQIASQELMGIALENLQSITQKHIWQGSEEMIPNNLFWLIQGEGLLGRCFHLHPLMVYPRKMGTNFLSTIDYDYPLSACPNIQEHYIVSDSDEILICELTTEKRVMRGVLNGSLRELIRFAELQTNRNHRKNAATCIKLHTNHVTPSKWLEAKNSSDAIFNQLSSALKTQSWKLFFIDPILLLFRTIRLGEEAKLHVNKDNYLSNWPIRVLGKISKMMFSTYTKSIRAAHILKRVLLFFNQKFQTIKVKY